MAASTYTKKVRSKLWIIRLVDFAILYVPLAIYIYMALSKDDVPDSAKVTVVSCLAVSLLLGMFNLLSKRKLRCPLWICLIGLYVATREYLIPLIIILAIATVLDDLVLTPLIQKYKTKLISSQVYDERESEEAVPED